MRTLGVRTQPPHARRLEGLIEALQTPSEYARAGRAQAGRPAAQSQSAPKKRIIPDRSLYKLRVAEYEFSAYPFALCLQKHWNGDDEIALRTRLGKIGDASAIRLTNVPRKTVPSLISQHLVDHVDLAPFQEFKGPLYMVQFPEADPKLVSGALKALAPFEKQSKLVVHNAFFHGQSLGAADARAFSTLPTLPEIHAQILGLLQSPANAIASTLSAPAAHISRTFQGYEEGLKE